MTTGEFGWRDCMSTDAEKAKRFYTSLFGWRIDTMEMGSDGAYSMFMNGDLGFGGVVPMEESDGHPSHWISYITTDDIEGTTAKATELGGSVPYPVFEIPGVGRAAVVRDPQGAYFMPFTSHQDATSSESHAAIRPGDVAWNELYSEDAAGSVAFYTRLFGYSQETVPSPTTPTGEYHILRRGETRAAGVLQANPEMPMTAWTIYFEVADIDAARAQVVELGGSNVTEIMQVPRFGRFSVASDPVGAGFAMIQSEGPA